MIEHAGATPAVGSTFGAVDIVKGELLGPKSYKAKKPVEDMESCQAIRAWRSVGHVGESATVLVFSPTRSTLVPTLLPSVLVLSLGI